MATNNQLSDADRIKYVSALNQKNSTAATSTLFSDRLAKAQTADTAAATAITTVYAALTATYSLAAGDVVDAKTGTITRA